MKLPLSLLGILFLLWGMCLLPGMAAERVVPLDLTKLHDPTDKVEIKALGNNEYEWTLTDGLQQDLNIDLKKLGINPGDYDELRFDVKPLGSQVRLHVVLFGFPTDTTLSSWYLKFKAGTDQWNSGRLDLRVDDDGAMYPERMGTFTPGLLRIELSRRILGFPGEPQWRTAIFRNPRLVKRLISTDFDLHETQIIADPAEYAYVYPLHVKNCTDQPQTAMLEPDPDHTMKYFHAEAQRMLILKPREEQVVPIRIAISRGKALMLPPGYAEPIYPKVSLYDIHAKSAYDGRNDDDATPLMGYRRFPMWGVVPASTRPPWTPQTFQAHVAAAEKFMPVTSWKTSIIRQADETLKYDFPALDWSPQAYDQAYRCPDCKTPLRLVSPENIHKHTCPKCGKIFENNPTFDNCARGMYGPARFRDMRNLATAYLLTGDGKYADKAITMMLAYADLHPTMTVTNYRSTGGGSRLGYNTLSASWMLPNIAEAYSRLSAYPGLDAEKRKRIAAFLIDEGIRLSRHCIEYSNMQGENIRACGSIGLATGFWPLVGEMLYGEFGWHEVVEYGFSEEGIGHEGQAYHIALFGAMVRFSTFAADRGINLYTPRFKRVFDGSLNVTGATERAGIHYELAYREYGDPAYLNVLETARKRNNEDAILYGELGIPSASAFPAESTLMPGMGYIFLRRGTAADSWELRMNYIEQYDRNEFDRFSTSLYRNGQQVDNMVARLNYTVPDSQWMEETASHNAIVIDGENQRPVTGKLVAYSPSQDTPIAVITTDPTAPLYNGVAQLRGIAILGETYVIFDRVTANKPVTIDRYQYGKNLAALQFKAAPVAAPLPHLNPHGHFTNIEGGACGNELRVDFDNGLQMRVVSDQPMQGYKALTFGQYYGLPMEVTFARVPDAKAATFLTTYSLGKDIQPAVGRIVKSTDEELVLDVVTKEHTYTITVKPAEKVAEVTVK